MGLNSTDYSLSENVKTQKGTTWGGSNRRQERVIEPTSRGKLRIASNTTKGRPWSGKKEIAPHKRRKAGRRCHGKRNGNPFQLLLAWKSMDGSVCGQPHEIANSQFTRLAFHYRRIRKQHGAVSAPEPSERLTRAIYK